MRDQYKVLIEKYVEEIAFNQARGNDEEVERIVDDLSKITQGYINLLNNRKVSGEKLSQYVTANIQPQIQNILKYVSNNPPDAQQRLANYLRELLTTTWLQVDQDYWYTEMIKLVRAAVLDNQAIVKPLQGNYEA